MRYLSNRPPPIKLAYLDKGILPYSAAVAQMKNLPSYFSLILGDQVASDEVYRYYRVLRELVSIVLIQYFPTSLLTVLQRHKLFMSIF